MSNQRPPQHFKTLYERYKQDADILFQKGRYSTSNHLIGFSAECGIKYLLVLQGMESIDAQGKGGNKASRKHINNGLIDYYEKYLENKSNTHCSKDIVTIFQTYFLDTWKVEQRYAASEEDNIIKTANTYRQGLDELDKILTKRDNALKRKS